MVERLSADLKTAFPDMKGLSPRNLKYMRRFAEAWPERAIVQQAVAQVPWGHNVRLLDKVKCGVRVSDTAPPHSRLLLDMRSLSKIHAAGRLTGCSRVQPPAPFVISLHIGAWRRPARWCRAVEAAGDRL